MLVMGHLHIAVASSPTPTQHVGPFAAVNTSHRNGKPVHGQTDDTFIVLRPGQHTTEVNIPLRQALPCRRAKPWREHHIPHTCKVLNQHTRIAHVRSTQTSTSA